jgi:hypothetical protein
MTLPVALYTCKKSRSAEWIFMVFTFKNFMKDCQIISSLEDTAFLKFYVKMCRKIACSNEAGAYDTHSIATGMVNQTGLVFQKRSHTRVSQNDRLERAPYVLPTPQVSTPHNQSLGLQVGGWE